jgi:hypothetical protein
MPKNFNNPLDPAPPSHDNPPYLKKPHEALRATVETSFPAYRYLRQR